MAMTKELMLVFPQMWQSFRSVELVLQELSLVGAGLVERPTCLSFPRITFHLERALFHFKQKDIILLRTVISLVLACVCPAPHVKSKRALEPVEGVALSCPDALVLPSACIRVAVLLYLVSLIQATSWSWAGLISFTPREEPVCGQTAHYGDDPAPLQVTN